MELKRIVPLSEYHRLPQQAMSAEVYKRLLEVVCNNATLAIFIMDEHQQCVYMNPEAERLTGYRLSETQGRVLHDVIHHTRPDGRPYPLCECPIDQAFPQNNQEQGEEVFVHKDGRFYPVAYTASPIREGDHIIGTIIEVRDITQEKLDEQARQELDRAKTEFFSNVSHEFRTPLTLMLGAVEDALTDQEVPLPTRQRERLEIMQRNGLRLLKLVNTLLDFSRVEANRMQAVYEATDLAALTIDLCSLFESAIAQAGLSFTIDCPALPELVYVDQQMWEKIVLNLISNAFKFTFTGGITVRLRSEGDRIELRVEDTGVGIPEAELPHLFQRFHRVSGTRSRTHEGSGIGLALVQELVKLHDGTIELNSQVGRGTTFIVTLPFRRTTVAINSSPPQTLASPKNRGQTFVQEALSWLEAEPPVPGLDHLTSVAQPSSVANGCARIVVADDNPDLRNYLRRLLSESYEVEGVTNGLAALTAIQQRRPDLVISDVMMPEMDGFELLRSLRSHPQTQDIPIILLSARAGEEAQIEGLEAGADDYLIKPFSARELLVRVEATLKLTRLRHSALLQEQALRAETEAAHRQITQILENMGDAFVALDRDWKITYLNTEAERINQKPRSETIGKTHWQEWPASVGTNVESQYRRAVQEQIPVHFEHHYYFPPVYDVWLEIHGYPSEDGLGIFYRDITERKRSEKALQESERRFRRLVESNMFGVAFGTFAGGVHYANHYFLNMISYTPEEVEAGQLRWLDITPPEFIHLDEKGGAELLLKGVSTPFEKEFFRKDGSRVPVLIGTTLLQEPYDEQQEIIAFCLDLTARKEVEAAWQEGKQTLDALMDYIPEGLTIADAPDATIRQISQYGQQLTGRPKENLVGIPATDHVERWGLLRPDGTTPLGDELPLTRAVQQGEIVTDEEWLIQRPDGTQVSILCNAGPIQDAEGNLTGGVLAWRDITERKQFEETLQQALQKLNFHVENTPMAVIEWNAQMEVIRWSGAAERIFGWHTDEVIGVPLTDLHLVVEEDMEEVTERVQRLMLGQEPYIFSSNRNYTKHREIVHCEWYNSSLRDESGQMLSVLSLVLDVTERQQAEAERTRLLQQEKAAREAAESANRIKDEFLAVLSHELRSPLNPILGWSRLLQSGKLDSTKTKQALETIERNAKLQAELIEDLLDVSRILRGKLNLNISSVDLVTVIHAALETVRLATEAKSIQIHTQLEPNLSPVLGDPSRLQQVIWNLLSNAVKFTPAGGQVWIHLEQRGSLAQITIRDTGKGISPEFLPYVFEYFRQENATTTRQFGGLGLGLAIVHHLVELHGGTVQAESEGEGKGATFTVCLPLSVVATETPLDGDRDNSFSDLNNLKVLVVDDDADTRDLVSFLLEQSGAIVIKADSASQGLQRLIQFQPDVLLSDIGMPDMDGYQLMRQVRRLPSEQGGKIPAIALTAYAGEIDYQRAISAGFQQHISKPVDPEKLIEAIASLIVGSLK